MKFLPALLLLSVFALSACTNTFQGAGRDIEKMGQTMQR